MLCGFQLFAVEWTQLGADVGAFSHVSTLSISADGKTVAIIDKYNGTSVFNSTGLVKVFRYQENNWHQVGDAIAGENPGDRFGIVTINSDGTRIAIGGMEGSEPKVSRVFELVENNWVQLGGDIVSSQYSSSALCLNADGSVLAVGASRDVNPNNSLLAPGAVRVFEWTGSIWKQIGDTFYGDGHNTRTGGSISLSSDGDKLAIGSPSYKLNNIETNPVIGLVRIYERTNSGWQQLGSDLNMSNRYSTYFGHTLSLSGDGRTLAVGLRENLTGMSEWVSGGSVSVYNYYEDDWVTKGHYSAFSGDWKNSNVSISYDGSRVAMTGYDAYYVSRCRIYDWSNNSWVQQGNEIVCSGGLSMSGNGEIVAVASGTSGLNSLNAKVRVYKGSTPLNPILNLSTFYESASGSSLVIDANAIDGWPNTFTYQWYFNGFAIPSFSNGTSPIYTIEGSELYNGSWRVEVTNDAGMTSAEFEYRVFTDADGDGLSDYRESNILSTNPNLTDTDNDGLNDYDEVITHLTDPNVTDSDSDGLSDGSEVNTYSTDPLDSDSDGDGLSDGVEVSTHSTDPIDADSDDDGLSDGVEISTHLTNPNSSDSDSDQLSDYAEINTHLTDPNDSDTDNDGLNDAIEINTYSTNPLTADTSGDGFNDGFIVGEGLNPTYDYSALRSSTISNVVSNSEAYGLYVLDNIKDLRPGSTMIEVSENQATVQIQMEESSDLQTWEDKGDPATMTIPANTDTKFFRFKMAE